jgi:hypothetical protein
MEDTREKIDNFPYPLRPSEIVYHVDFLSEVQPLPLTEAERGEILAFEEPLFGELQKLKEISVSTHTIFPEAFTSEKGSRLFSAIYLDRELKDRLDSLATKRGVELEKTEARQKFYDAFFDDLAGIVDSNEAYLNYKEEGFEFASLSAVLKELGDKNDETVVLKGNVSEAKKLTKEEIKEKFFAEVDLASIPEQLRTRVSRYSSEWAKEQFAQAFQKAGGNVDKISNPERITRIVNVDKLAEKVGGLRDFKKRLKKMRQEFEDGNDNLTEAKRIIINLYQKYGNVLLAQEYDSGRILSAQPRRTEKEEEALGALKGTNRVVGDEDNRFSPKRASRTLERIDHFLAGTGVKIGENGLFATIPEGLAKYVRQRALEPPPEETEEYKRFNSYRVNAQQAATLCRAILERYGFTQGDRPWRAVVLERKGTLAVNPMKKEVRIPKSFKRGLIETLAVLAHEVEGHVLRHVNQEENFNTGLRLIEEFTTGRGGILSEAAAMRIEDDTKQAMVGQKREALPYYYLALLEKRRGGSFKDCFRAFFEAHAERKYGLSLEEAVNDKETYREVFDYAYDRTLRIFRVNTPLDDKSGYLPTSEQLKYIEQELIVDVLRKKGLAELLHVAGLDLYSLQELRRLGMLDLSRVKNPRMVVAEEIWPKIKSALEEGKTLEEVIGGLG